MKFIVAVVLAISLAVLVLGYPSVEVSPNAVSDGHSIVRRSPQSQAPNQALNWDGIFNIPIAALQAVNQFLSNSTKANNGR